MPNITFEQEPVNTADKVPVITNWNPMIGYMLYYDDISGLFYFRLVLEVRLDSSTGTLIAKIKQRRNGYGPDNNGATQRARAFFDLRSIVNSQLVNTVEDQNPNGIPFGSIHKLGANLGEDSDGDLVTLKIFSVNGDSRTDETQMQTIYVKGYQQSSDAVDAIPSEITTLNVEDTLIYMAASLPLLTARDDESEYIQGTAFQPYQASSGTDRFLSDVGITTDPTYGVTGYINYVQWDSTTNVGDYHTVAFLNDFGNFSSDLDFIVIKFYDASGSLLSTDTAINNSTYGGWPPSTSTGMEDKHRLLYFGCGPGNLEGQTIPGLANAKPSDAANDGWAYYKIQGIGAGGETDPATANYYFIKESGSCKGFKVRRLAWRNSVGCYDYFNFKMKSTQTIEVTRNNYNTIMGRFNASKWYYNNTMRGKKTREVTAVLKETLNTDWMTEDQAYLMEKLIMSTDVYIVENADTEFTQGVMVTDSSIVKKTIANDKLIKYTIQIEYANNVNTNS
jgi:hypothetical protein